MELSARGFNTLLVGTKTTVVQVCEEIKARYHTQSYAYMADLSRREEVLALAEKINSEHPVSILVNNAGVGGTRSFADAPTDYLENIIDLNVRCTALLTHALLPNLMQQKRSYVLNIGSMAAHNPTGYKTVYPASKSFVLSFSLGLREELKGTPVSVSVCSPGAMATNAEVTARIEKQGFWGKATLKNTDRIARKCVRRMFRRKRLIVVNPLASFLSAIVPDCIRLPILTRIVRREME
jgi:short-subunit dehydrogenase